MTGDHWTHQDPAVRDLIAKAAADAWDQGATYASPYAGAYLRSLLFANPHRDYTTATADDYRNHITRIAGDR